MMPKINYQSRKAGHFPADTLELRYTVFLAQKRSMIGLFLCALLTASVMAGCKKHEVAVSANPPPTDQGAVAPTAPGPHGPGPMAASTAPAVVPDTGDINATLHDLSLELRKYVLRTRSIPKTFEEFAAKSRVQMPPAPAGKKYAIEGQAVVLVKN